MPKAIVLATMGNKKADINAFLFSDEKLNKNFLANCMNPWSPYTGKSAVRKNMEKKVLSSQNISEKMHFLCDCPSCHSHITVNAAAAADKRLQKHLFCTICATDLHTAILTDDDADMTLIPTGEDEAIGTNTIGADEEPINSISDDIDLVTTEHGSDEDSTGDLIRVKRKSSLRPLAADKDKKKVNAKKHKERNKDREKNKEHEHKNRDKEKDQKNKTSTDSNKDTSREDAPLTQRREPAKIDAPAAQIPANSTDQTFEEVTGEPVTANVRDDKILFNFNTVNLTKADLAVVPLSAEKSYLFANEIPVMVLTAANANKSIKELFTQPDKLLEAIDATLTANTFEPTHFGAKGITAKVQLSKTIAKQMRLERKKLQAKYDQNIDELNKSYFKALSIAAVAVNKNTVDKYPNTLKASLIKVLKESGVRNPERMIDTVFSSEDNDNFLRNILDYAREFQRKPKSAQKEIAKFIAKTPATASVIEDDNDDELNDDVGNIADHLSNTSSAIALASLHGEVEKPSNFGTVNKSDYEYFSNLIAKR